MFGALKTVEDHNLYASFGLVDNLEENELQDINGGWCACKRNCQMLWIEV